MYSFCRYRYGVILIKSIAKDLLKYLMIIFISLFLIVLINILFSNYLQAANDINWQQLKETSYYKLQKEPDSIIDNFNYSIALANLGMIEEAYEYFNNISDSISLDEFNRTLSPKIKELERKEDDILLLNYAAFNATINVNYREAVFYFSKILKYQPNNIWIINYLAASYIEIEEYEKAEKELLKCLEIKENQYSHLLLGLLNYKQGRILRALIELSRSGNLAKHIFFGN